jgi:hypothetical protein
MHIDPADSSGLAADESLPDVEVSAAAPPDAASHRVVDVAAGVTGFPPLPPQLPGLITELSRLCLWDRMFGDAGTLGPLQPGVDPAFYQGPGVGVSAPAIGTHLGMTEDAGRFNGFNENFTGWIADRNAQVDFREYDNDAAHAYNFSGPATMNRATELGGRIDAAVTRYNAATTPAERRQAAQDIATEFGRYQHMVQDNWAHGGTNREQHYGAHVDDNPQSMAAARREARASFAEFGAYLQSRGIDPATIDPGPRPDYCWPPFKGVIDKQGAPDWDGKDRMWDRGAMQEGLRERFNAATPLGDKPVAQ